MAIRYATVSGNWNAVGTWNGGATIPTAGDDVYANGFTVTINQHITVTKISNEVCPTTSVGGGSFNIITFTVTANIVAGTTRCLITTGAGNPTFIGNIYGGTGTDAQGVYTNNFGSFTLIGNIYGGSGTGAAGVTHYNLTAANITGNIYGGDGAEGMIRALGTGTITLVGNITAGVFAGSNGIALWNITGNVLASATANGIYAASIHTNLINISGQLTNYQEKMAIANYSRIYFSPSSSTAWTFYDSDNVSKPLYTADVLENPPVVTDVRTGVVYGIANNYTGTCAVPAVESVVKNVPVGATVGTLEMTPSLFIDALKADDLGKRLENCATAEIVSAIIKNLK